MIDVAVAVALHVLAIVLWIGGAGFATLALLPALRRLPDPAKRIAMFEAMESRFAPVARAAILLAGATGLYMAFRLNIWSWFISLRTWWMGAMLVVWIIFAVLLFVLEPFFLHHRFIAHAKSAPDAAFRKAERLHWMLLIISLVTILGAAAGTHGFVPG
jgi:uncharacterized membrane protein